MIYQKLTTKICTLWGMRIPKTNRM